MAKKSSPFYNSKDRKISLTKSLKNSTKSVLFKPILSSKRVKNNKLFKPIIDVKTLRKKGNPLFTPLIDIKAERKKGNPLFTPLLKPKKEVIDIEKKKQLRRLHRFINSAEKRGYTFQDNIIDTSLSAEELAQIKPKDLYKLATYKDDISGEILTGEQGKEIENYRRLLKTQETKKQKQIEKQLEIDETDYILEDYETDELGYYETRGEIEAMERDERFKQRKEEYKPDYDLTDNAQFNSGIDTVTTYNEFVDIEERLQSIPEYVWVEGGKKLSLSYEKMEMINLWRNLVNNLTIDTETGEVKVDGVEKLYDYITDNNVAQKIADVEEACGQSNSEPILDAINRLITVLNGGQALTPEQAKRFEVFNEMNDYVDEE